MYHQSWGCVGRRRGKYLASFSHDLGGMCCDNHKAKARNGRENVYSCAPAGEANPPPPRVSVFPHWLLKFLHIQATCQKALTLSTYCTYSGSHHVRCGFSVSPSSCLSHRPRPQ